MMVSNFPKIVKHLLKDLPRNDYPVLNTFKFVLCWLGWTMDKSLGSMNDLFSRLNSRGDSLHISTFSKANKVRDVQVFAELLEKVLKELKQKKEPEKLQKMGLLSLRFNRYYLNQ